MIGILNPDFLCYQSFGVTSVSQLLSFQSINPSEVIVKITQCPALFCVQIFQLGSNDLVLVNTMQFPAFSVVVVLIAVIAGKSSATKVSDIFDD